MAAFFKQLKPFLRWFVLALTLGFLGHTLTKHWREVLMLRLTAKSLAGLGVATGVTLLAHIWSGWVWYGILKLVGAPGQSAEVVILYLKTNLAKYIPGNVWHFLGRVKTLERWGASTDTAIVGVVLDPLLMAAAALGLTLLGGQNLAWWQFTAFAVAMVGVHPRILNPILRVLSRAKLKKAAGGSSGMSASLQHYPLLPFLGGIVFVIGRGIGFLLAVNALESISSDLWLFVIGNFSLAWLLGLVVPGAPGGLGVFEATALALMTPTLSPAVVLGGVALYRLIGTIAETIAAFTAWLDEGWNARFPATE